MDWVADISHQTWFDRTHKQEQHGPPVHHRQEITTSRSNRHARSYNFSQKLVLLATGMFFGALTVIVMGSANLIDLGDGTGNDRLQRSVSVPSQQSVVEREGYINRESRVGLIGSVTPANKVTGFEMPPSTADVKDKPSNRRDANKNHPGATAVSDHEFKPPQAIPAVKTQGKESSRSPGAWVINLASLKRKVDAENFAIMARSRGVAAKLYQATVRGTKYWRVQLPGFSSAVAASTKAGEVQNRLGLKDAWILKR